MVRVRYRQSFVIDCLWTSGCFLIFYERNKICAAIERETWQLTLSLCGRRFIKADDAAWKIVRGQF